MFDVSQVAYPVAAIRAAESAKMAELPDGELMRRAAFALSVRVVDVLRERRGGCYGATVAVVAGRGNNGGDARLAGSLLARRGVAIVDESADPARVEIALDGLVGIGGRGGLRPEAMAATRFLDGVRAAGGYVVAVDVPSGVDSDSGAVDGVAVTADETVTFGCLKVGLIVTPGAWRAGRITTVDIGLSFAGAPLARLASADANPELARDASKYTRGVVGIVAGSREYPGAAQLAVAGGLAGGAGMVRYVGTAPVTDRFPEVIAAPTLGEAGRVQAWVVGPGMPPDAATRQVVADLVGRPLPLVIDAGGLAVLDYQLRAGIRRRDAPTVLTPHEGEFARLFGPIEGRLTSARTAASELRAIVVLKGDRTIVTDGRDPAWIGPTGAAGLATGGTGDVLAGLIASTLATGIAPVRAAATAVARHAAAGGSRPTHALAVAERLLAGAVAT